MRDIFSKGIGMKKRLKGLFVLWLTFLMVVSTPMTAYATISEVYLYIGTEALTSGYEYGYDTSFSENFLGKYNGNSSNIENDFKVGTSLKDTFSYMIPEGYGFSGWKLWNGGSGLSLSNPSSGTLSYDYVTSENDVSSYVTLSDNNISSFVVEAALEKLEYEITHQPDNENPYVEIGKNGVTEEKLDGIVNKYEWYAVKKTTNNVTNDNINILQEEDDSAIGNYDSTSGFWSGVGSVDTGYTLKIGVSGLTVGDTLQIIPRVGDGISMEVIFGNLPLSKDELGVWSCTIPPVEYYELSFTSSSTFSIEINSIHEDISLVDEQTTSTFSGDNGDYYCKVIFENGGWLSSNRFTYTRSAITPNPTSNGSYKLQVDGKDITENVSESGTDLLMIPEKTVTVVPTPDNGYELDTISVKTQNSDGVGEEIPVTDNAFTMPDCPVTVTVTFKKKTYEITLPTNPVGYTVNPVPVGGVQKTSVEHGGSYEFCVSINYEYVATNNYAVKANDTTLTATSTVENGYIYTIKNVTEAQTITVTGVNELHPITTLGKSTEGSYTVTAGDGSDVPVAAKGTMLIIKPTPADGYELDTVTVVKTDDSSTAVEVVENSFTMPDYPVTVSVTFKKLTYAITLPKDTVGYTVGSTQPSPVEHGGSYTFAITIQEGYAASADFEVQANGTYLPATKTGDNVYTCKIENVTSEQTVTVSGVVDGRAPAINIILDDKNSWQSFLSKISFELFFKEEKSLTIDAKDAEGEIKSVEYYLTNSDLFQEERTYTAEEIERAISGWISYTEPISLSGNGIYVLYAKATDTAGNVSYASTTGIVIDTKKPEISGIKDGDTYYGDISFTVGDDYLKTVTVDDGEPMEVDNSPYTYTITADNKQHTITAEDQAGNSISYSITVYKTYTVTLPEETVGYTVKGSQGFPVYYGRDYSFTVTIEEGYEPSGDFTVQANGSALTATDISGKVYTYTIKNVTEAQKITITGVKDGTAPVVKIVLDERNWWQSFLNKITFGLFFKETKNLTIESSDKESGIQSVQYYLTNTDLFPEDTIYTAEEIENRITGWTEYKESISLAGDQSYVLYAKAIDKEGNVSYASTTGIVIDTTKPVISGIMNGASYYGDISFTVSDDYLSAVKVDGTTVQPDAYKVSADNASHTVVATDKAGNSVTYTITVYKKYDMTLPTETVGYKVEGTQTSPVNHGSSYSFTVSILDGYKATEKYAVQVNNKTIEPIEYGIDAYYYTIDSVTEPLSISVIGVNKLHEIAISEAINGSYTVSAEDESNVATAVKDTKLTITPSPEEGYELDKITVIQKDGSNTTVTVDDKNQFTMPDYPVTVSVTFKKLTYAITLPTKTVGYTVDSTQSSSVEYGSDYTFKVTVSEGYDVPTALSVKANGNVLVATSINGKEYTYTLEKVVATQEITVGGVSDITGPAVTITLDENNTWKNFLIKIGFGLFFKVEKNLTITAADAGSGIGSVMYYVSESDLFPKDETYSAEDIESRIPEWTEYTEAVSISEDKSYVVYAKATDEAGNVSYASTSGIVIDTTAPVISGLENGGTYYGDTSATISDDNLSTVKLDGKEVEFTGTNASVTIFADSEEHTIEVADKAGNQTTYRVGVYETWVRDGISTAGSRSLKSGVPYKFGSGKWKVAGDTTVYEGGNTFYASEEGTFEFQNQ